MTEWAMIHDADDEVVYAVLNADRIWNGYSICDLEPPLRQYTRVALALGQDKAHLAACVFLQHPEFSALVSHGDPEGIAVLLAAQAALPSPTFILAQQSHVPAIEMQYQFAAVREAMRRMMVDRRTFKPVEQGPSEVVKLTLSDLPALEALYDAYSSNAFAADQLRSGVFYGVRQGDTVIAAGGTHALAPSYGIAAVGNIYTQPHARGRGYASAITTAIITELLEGPYSQIILNVAEANQAARRLYQRLGFRDHCHYWEGRAFRRERDHSGGNTSLRPEYDAENLARRIRKQRCSSDKG